MTEILDHEIAFKPRPLSGPAAPIAPRKVKPIPLAGLHPLTVEPGVPLTFETVAPETLLVDETYQRELSRRSYQLVERIINTWDWRRFKPPVVARTPEGLMVIDGQHTAIAAASHPDIPVIPVMVVGDLSVSEQAQSFVGHNKDRLNLTKIQIHAAAVAAGDEDALTVNQVCERAGVKMLKIQPSGGDFRPGETMAVSAIETLVRRRGPQKARVVLQILAEAGCAPVSSLLIKAIEMLMHGQEYAGTVKPQDLTSAIMALGEDVIEREAAVFRAAHRVPQWRAAGVIIYRRARRGSRRAD